MKRKNSFLLRQVAGKQVVVPLGKAAVEFPGMLTLNSSGVYLWQLLEQEQTEDSLVHVFCGHYDVTEEIARQDIAAFLEKLRSVGALEE